MPKSLALTMICQPSWNVLNEPVTNAFTQHFTVDDFAAAAAEWDTRSESDSDNDMM
jgi:hypothetical protein